MTAADIIKGHRENLVRRIVSRSPLLRFIPGGSGGRVDVCEMFPKQQELVPAEQNCADAVCNTADEFLEHIFSGNQVRARIEQPPARALANASKKAADHKRTLGQWTLVLAWPFLYVPGRNLENTNRSLFAPLFLWRIKVSSGGSKIFRLQPATDVNSECEPNFMLAEYTKVRGDFKLLYTEEILEKMQDNSNCDEKARAIVEWLGAIDNIDIENLKEFNAKLQSYTKSSADSPRLMPVAALGNAKFNYLALFRDLQKLEEKARNGEDLGLLGRIFDKRAENPPPPDNPGVPSEEEKWLVETSDPSQEKAVWQSRVDAIPIARLEGPPGTGKSQTIVNIVAEALHRKQKVAVVCHQTAALDVVRKRLEAIARGDLVVQITAPKENRTEVINKARAIEAGGEEEYNREEICTRITINEKICDERTAEFSPDPYDYRKTRGHCMAKIAAIANNTGFYAHDADALDDGSPSFCSIVAVRLQQNGGDKKLLNEIQDIVRQWEECDYPEHLWQKIDDEWEGKKHILQTHFEVISRKLGELDAEELSCNYLPAGGALPYAAHPILAEYYWQITDKTRRDSIKTFAKIVKITRKAFEYAKISPCPLLWEDLHLADTAMRYAAYNQAINGIDNIIAIKKAIRTNPVVASLAETFPQELTAWKEIGEAAVCKFHLNAFLAGPTLRDYEQAKTALAAAIEKKKRCNAQQLIHDHNTREAAANELMHEGLLRLRGGQRPAPTLRRLYHSEAQNGDTIWERFPVLLANPDAVSQIMPLEMGCLDLLIVDEASQMFTADVMPLLYRAKRAVISGDEHQMPPSRFFAMNDEQEKDDEDKDDKDDEPNIEVPYELLEAMDTCTEEISKLGVHYRSRAAELIAFSNHAFYHGSLQVAPDNQNLPAFMNGHAIHMEHIVGNFDGGVNKNEVNEIITMLRTIWDDGGNRSVGVIVFNTTQRNLLLEELDNKSERDEKFRVMYEVSKELTQDGKDVGFFVRSVEHVQGDERDIIILGTTYGPDRRNFVAISVRDHGRRRLNVAITRAKEGMIVVTSLNIDDIANDGDRPDDGGTEGAERWYLWQYMKYARAVANGDSEAATAILRHINPKYQRPPSGQKPENEFELKVGKFLQDNDLHVDYQVGESGFRIDIGVKKNGNDATYLCGVECDGRTYHSSWRAREHDIWRQKILEDKGWRIQRIWSDKWFSGNKEEERRKFLEEVRGTVDAG